MKCYCAQKAAMGITTEVTKMTLSLLFIKSDLILAEKILLVAVIDIVKIC